MLEGAVASFPDDVHKSSGQSPAFAGMLLSSCRQCSAMQRWHAQQLPLSTRPAYSEMLAAWAAGRQHADGRLRSGYEQHPISRKEHIHAGTCSYVGPAWSLPVHPGCRRAQSDATEPHRCALPFWLHAKTQLPRSLLHQSSLQVPLNACTMALAGFRYHPLAPGAAVPAANRWRP